VTARKLKFLFGHRWDLIQWITGYLSFRTSLFDQIFLCQIFYMACSASSFYLVHWEIGEDSASSWHVLKQVSHRVSRLDWFPLWLLFCFQQLWGWLDLKWLPDGTLSHPTCSLEPPGGRYEEARTGFRPGSSRKRRAPCVNSQTRVWKVFYRKERITPDSYFIFIRQYYLIYMICYISELNGNTTGSSSSSCGGL
jgi:hypothetical protein